MEPMTRSAYAFCHGERGAVRTSWMPIPVTVGPIPAKGVITIANEIPRHLVPRKRLTELLGGPRRRGMAGDGHVYDAATLMRQNDQHEQESTRGGRHDEEIGGRDLADMIREKRAPRL